MMLRMQKRRDLLKFFGLSTVAKMPLSGASEPHLANEVIEASHAKLSREPFGDLRVFFQGPTAQLKSMTAGSLLLKPGREPHPPHQHPEEEFMVVTEGSGEMLVGGKKVKVGPGSMMYCESNQLHGVKNTGTQPLLFYYYKFLA
jgi:mannose-6-phosphate isomerase-like protein (cupin superfamily)